MNWFLSRLADEFGVEPARPGEAITPSLRFETPWPQGLTLLVLALAIGLIVYIYRHEGPAPGWYRGLLAGIRISLVGLALFMLAEAVLAIERVGLPYFVVMVDDSASMARVDRFENPAERDSAEKLARATNATLPDRLTLARGWLKQDNAALLKGLLDGNRIRLYRLSADARVLAEINRPDQIDSSIDRLAEVKPTGIESRLGAGIRQVLTELRGAPPTGILLLTDGQTTQGESLASASTLAERKGVPIYLVGLGDAQPPKDLALTDLIVDEVVFVKDTVRFQAKLSGRGFEGLDIPVRLLELPANSTDPAQGKEVARITVKVAPDGQSVPIQLVHRPETVGEISYVIDAAVQPREEREENNQILRRITVREDKLKVLLVDGRPRYEYRYLKSFLERRPETIDLSVVLQSADPEYSTQDLVALPALPTSGEGDDGLFSYDVVILGDADPAFVSPSQLELLSKFVTEKGGGLVFISGEDFNPLQYRATALEPLLPILLDQARDPAAAGQGITPFSLSLTAEGQSSPIFAFGDDPAENAEIWRNLPPHYWYFDAPRKQPAAFVLAERPQGQGDQAPTPIMLYQFVGAGKTMFVGIDDTWRWRLGVGDRYFGRFWIQTIRFMARSRLEADRQAQLITDRRLYRDQQPVQVRLRFAASGTSTPRSVQVELTGPTGLQRALTLDAGPGPRPDYQTVIPPLSPGDYKLRLLPPPALDRYPTADFRVEAPASETERIELNTTELATTAERSGGKVFSISSTPGEVLEALPSPQKVPLEADPPIPLWNDWRLLTLFLGLLSAEWILRKRKQMV